MLVTHTHTSKVNSILYLIHHKTVLANYIKSYIEEWKSAHNSCRQYKVKLGNVCIGYTILTAGHLMSRNDKQPLCRTGIPGNHRLIIKHCL